MQKTTIMCASVRMAAASSVLCVGLAVRTRRKTFVAMAAHKALGLRSGPSEYIAAAWVSEDANNDFMAVPHPLKQASFPQSSAQTCCTLLWTAHREK